MSQVIFRDYFSASRCPACPERFKCVPPSGPKRMGGNLFIGEAPGWEEDKQGIPFVGKTGREVNEHYLPLAGLKRGGEDFTNAIKCMPDRPKGKLDMNREVDRELLEACSEHFLFNEIEQLQPGLLIPMGAFACWAIDPNIDLEVHHGMPVDTRLGMAFPMYHPAQGIHEPKKMLQIRNDWIRLRRYLRGTLHLPVDRYPNPDYGRATERDIADIDPTLPLCSDTEYSKSRGPYFLTYSQQPGYARLIQASNSHLITKLQDKLDRWESSIYFHNWPYDWSITEDMGLQFPVPRVHDTMLAAFHLGNLPQGLKVLAYRLLGMKMQDYEDLVKPYSISRVYDYYSEALAVKDWSVPEERMITDDKTGLWRVYKPQGLKTKLKRLFTDLNKNPDKDIFKVWENWEEHHEELEARLGPYVPLDIADVPFDKALYYACRDSDATMRLVPILNKMKEIAMTGKLQEMWDLEIV